MFAINSTEVRKEFGGYIDIIIRKKPVFIKRSRDYIMGISIDMAKELVKDIKFEFEKYIENDGSVTLSFVDFDFVVNGSDFEKAICLLIKDLREYAEEYYNDIEYWSTDVNRKNHLPSILKVLMTDDEELRESLLCLAGES